MDIDISEVYDDNGRYKWRTKKINDINLDALHRITKVGRYKWNTKKINDINKLMQHIDYWLITRPHETRGILYNIKLLINLCDINCSKIHIIPSKTLFRIILFNHKIWEYITLLHNNDSFMNINIVDVNGRIKNFIFGLQDIDTKIKMIYREYNDF